MASKKKGNHNFLSDSSPSGSGGFELPKIEERVLNFWKSAGIFERTLAARKGKKTFVFYEGPPYANGKPGIHHVLARVVKDIMLRYKTMRGFFVPRKAGWDTHGLPVEIAAEKALGLKSKRDIETYGIEAFNAKAKEAVWTYKDEWERLTNRIGYWLDLTNAYVTYTSDYIETIWWTLHRMWEKKLLYQGHRVVPWCTRCGTALSSHELAQGYKEVEDTSVYVKFRVKPGQKIALRPVDAARGRQAQGKADYFVADEKTYILSWTTTPWTLPGNVALAVGEEISYLRIFLPDTNESLFVARDLARKIFHERAGEDRETVLGKSLVGVEYEPLFDVPSFRTAAAHRVYPADFVTTTDGTGVVHTAVMYGEDDYRLGITVGLPARHTVAEDGRFVAEVPDGLAGLPVKDPETEKKIFARLTEKNFLFATERYTHEYPHCWRCGTPVLYYARHAWFIGMSRLREKLLANNKTVSWYPAHVKDGRFGEWLREVKDWNLSRERYWGAPLPIWVCADCKRERVVASVDELAAAAGKARNAYFVMRHGKAESLIFDRIDDGQRKYHLTTIGRDQVRRSAEKLRRGKAKIDFIVASDILRTRETAEIVGGMLGVEVHYDDRLREIHLGELEGCHSKAYARDFPTYESRFERVPEGGESLRTLRGRLAAFVADMERRYEGKTILLVSHEYPIWMLTATAAGWTEKRSIAEKERHGEEFLDVAEVRPLEVRSVPRNSSGELDLHRPFVDEIVFPCENCGGEMRRVPEVADVWYDSGAMPYAQQHYPFENKAAIDKRAVFPADYISEGIDQTRGWFYTLLAIATALGLPAPYKNVICLELVNDKNGQKMSKSKGNIVDPWMIIDKFGVDAVRWYFFSGTPLAEPKNFDEAEVGKALRRFHLIIYNSLVFFETYGVRDAKLGSAKPKNVLDRWILARLAETIEGVSKELDRYGIREAALILESFTDDLSRWYIRRSRRRLQKPESKADYLAASATLGYVLRALVRLVAPFTPFFAEALYQSLRGAKDPESVHLALWPSVERRHRDPKLTVAGAEVRRLASAILAKRAELGIKVRQPLASATVKTAAPALRASSELLAALAEEVNVKTINFDSKQAEEFALDTHITAELKAEGVLRDISRSIQELRQEAKLKPSDKVALFIEATGFVRNILEGREEFFAREVGARAVTLKRSPKFLAELSSDLEGEKIWIGIRKA